MYILHNASRVACECTSAPPRALPTECSPCPLPFCRWGTKNFRQLGLRKCELILSLLRAGADPIVTDADALITRDPTPFVLKLRPEAQVREPLYEQALVSL